VKLFKSKAVSSKAHRNTETVILWGFKFFALPVSGFRNANFLPGLVCPIKPRTHICPYSWSIGISKKSGFKHILGQLRSILWRLSAILRFGATGPDLPAFLLYPMTAFFVAQLLS